MTHRPYLQVNLHLISPHVMHKLMNLWMQILNSMSIYQTKNKYYILLPVSLEHSGMSKNNFNGLALASLSNWRIPLFFSSLLLVDQVVDKPEKCFENSESCSCVSNHQRFTSEPWDFEERSSPNDKLGTYLWQMHLNSGILSNYGKSNRVFIEKSNPIRHLLEAGRRGQVSDKALNSNLQ